MLIVFDGADGVGKGTQVERAVQFLRKMLGEDQVVQSKDPGGTKLGLAIRRLMFEEVPTTEMANGEVDLLFLAAHRNNWRTCVKPALDAGKIVVQDRWWPSQAAYMTQREVPKLIADAYMGCHGADPDLFVFLYGDVHATLDRARARDTETHQSAKAWNDYDTMDRIQAEYVKQFSTMRWWWPVCVDDKGPNEVWVEVELAIRTFMRKAGKCL